MRRFANKVALVSAAGSGIGRGVAVRLAQEGRVVVTDIDGDSTTSVAAEIEAAGGAASGWPLDATRPADWQRVAEMVEEDLGQLNVLILNAGHNKPGRIEIWMTMLGQHNSDCVWIQSSSAFPFRDGVSQ